MKDQEYAVDTIGGGGHDHMPSKEKSKQANTISALVKDQFENIVVNTDDLDHDKK